MNFATVADIILIAPIIVIFLGSLVPLTLKVLLKNKEPNDFVPMFQGFGALLASFLLLITVYKLVLDRENAFAFSRMMAVDGVSLVSGLVILVASMASLVLTRENPTTRGHQYSELVFLLLNSTLGMIVLTQATDLLMIFVGLEVMSLPLYVLIGMGHDQKLSKEASIKYFVLGSFASAFFLMGLSFIYGTTGSTSLLALAELGPAVLNQSPLFTVGFLMMLCGFAFKVSLFPFHAWTADVYQGAPTPHTTLMATAVKLASFVALLRIVMVGYFESSEVILNVLQWFAAVTMLIGNAGALVQNKIKRVLAYSSVAHSGYLILGLLVVGLGGPGISEGVTVSLFYLTSYAFMTVGAFAFISYLEKSEGQQIGVEELSGLAYRRPYMALSMSLLLFSLAGVPPTLGFFGKFYLFTEALSQGFVWLTIWAALSSVVGVYYYLRPIVMMYMKEESLDLEKDNPSFSRILTKSLVFICALVVLILGIFNAELFDFIRAKL